MHEVVHPHSPGAIVLEGTVYDGAGQPIPDALHRDLGRGRGRHRSRAAAARSAATTTPSPASAAQRRTTTATTSSGPATPAPSAGKAPFFAVIVFARGLPDKLHTRIYLPDDEEALRRRRAAVLARRRRARYAHRDAHARGRPSPRHPAAGREGDRVPCLLTIDPRLGGDARAFDAGLLSPVTLGFDDVGDGCRVPRRAGDRRGRADPRLGGAGVGDARRDEISDRFGLGARRASSALSMASTSSRSPRDAVAGGNPVIPLIAAMKAAVDARTAAARSTAVRRARTSSTPR